MSEPANASSRKSIREAEKAARIRDRQRREVITSLMSTRPGRSWLWDTLSSCSIFSTTHVPSDALGSAFQEGRRSMGLALLSDILAACPDQFILAMREHNERHLNNHDPAALPADAERLSGAQPDGGDSGAEPDSTAEPDPADAIAASTFAADIYATESPRQ
jgi:hypothetical protein